MAPHAYWEKMGYLKYPMLKSTSSSAHWTRDTYVLQEPFILYPPTSQIIWKGVPFYRQKPLLYQAHISL